MQRYQRAVPLLGEAGLERLGGSHVAMFGLGGVGGSAAEALARCAVGELTLVDGDRFERSNLNRQLGALESTLGREKARVWAERIADLAPDCRTHPVAGFLTPENADDFDFAAYDYVIDAIDQVTAKLLLIERCRAAGTPIICSMGTGNRLDPSRFRVGDIYETRDCGLARVMRRELRRRGIPALRVVYSLEPPVRASVPQEGATRHAPASVSFVPPVAGYLLAGEVIRTIAGVDCG